jgi:SAM-dependent methyltransferase
MGWPVVSGVLAANLLMFATGGAEVPASPSEQTPARKPDVMFVPSEPVVIDAMLRLAKVQRGDVVYDLGCGDGRIVIAAALRTGARGVGIDIDPGLIADANIAARRAGVADRVRFVLGDIFDPKVAIADATVVTLFLLPDVNRRLKPRLIRELKPGTRVVSNSFDMGPDWPPAETAQAGDFVIYLWRIPSERSPS